MLQENYRRTRYKKCVLILAAFIFTLISGYIFTTIGMKQVHIWQVFTALEKFFYGTINTGSDEAVNKIILLLRLPRILMAILAGIGLAVAGAVMQSVTRNYLVSPFTLGISAAAAFGASLCIVFGTGTFFQSDFGIIFCAFVSACICGLIVYGVAQRTGLKPSSIVLVGIALNYLFSAMTAVIEFFAKEHKLEAVVQWTFGSLNRAAWDYILITLVIVACGIYIMMYYCLPLNAIAGNDDEMVKSLGVNPKKVRSVCGIISVLITSAIISFTGVIGFVGLIAPHMARIIIGNDHRFYILFSGIIGAMLLLVSDTIGKFILYPVNIPVGIIISFLGVPLFIHLILTKRNGLE